MKQFLIAILIFSTQVSFGQKRQIYSYDFDYKTLSPKDPFTPSDLMPNYYVLTTYSNDVLTDIDIFQKEEWMGIPLQTHAKVETKNKMTFFIYDSGKMRVGGYGGIFPKKTNYSDTAMLINDTLIFKTTNRYQVQLHYMTSIFSDSISICQKNFPMGDKKSIKKTSLSNFSFYKDWNKLQTYSRFYQVNVTINRKAVIRATRQIADNAPDYSYAYSHDLDYFQKKKMPISLFWIKHTGMIY